MYDFRKKPVVIKAIRLTSKMTAETLEGTMTASPGDWMIQGTQGELYFVKDAIFREIYKPHTKSAKSYFQSQSESQNKELNIVASEDQDSQVKHASEA